MPQPMTLSQVMKQLEAQGDAKVRQRYVRDGAGDNVFGVLLGKIRALAQALGTNHALGLELWATGNHEARILACMLLDPRVLTEKEARALLEPLANPTLVDELVGRVLVSAPVAEALQTRWIDGNEELPRRAGWKLLAGRIARGLAKDLDVAATLARIERELPAAPYRVKEGINYCLVWIGLHLPAYTGEAIAIGERLGRWDPRPIPKGCTSSYAPEWIAAALALRSGEKTEARQAMEAATAKKKAAPAKKKSAATKTPAPKHAR
ncbi:3-methyladenine DNA glycosylase AlkD [Nannocystis exedens]|uniref:3-methyladenine DNA glycosylase AlkD n=1 Tax=Nannocystis exedens TaxID=54 RepID=A0A1I2EM70_9BACT|nr:DNA alkylation repair protein [Nannocystis exedens]PCC73960.1 DNA alkylation repair enzyme [Nannocystis exedens]SFE93616.1 3-methyladenine DNA glycosylase AlkD [Nannocystis exedens]